MTITQAPRSNTDIPVKQTKLPKRTKGNKKPVDKITKESNSGETNEKTPKAKPGKSKIVCNEKALVAIEKVREDALEVKDTLKKTQLVEKRKQDTNEWKPMKKVDYQRLETVVEEGQLSSEETASRDNALEESDSTDGEVDVHWIPTDFSGVKQKKLHIHSLVPIAEHWEFRKQIEEETEIARQTCDKGDTVSNKPILELLNKAAEVSDDKFASMKRNLNGMMEILPIFSNNKFVCSRDAISIEECDDLDPMDRREKGHSDIKSAKASDELSKKSSYATAIDCQSLDIKPFISANSIKKDSSHSPNLDDRMSEKAGGCKEHNTRKMRYNLLTDRNFSQRNSSPFINSLLVMKPFSEERERLMMEERDIRRDGPREGLSSQITLIQKQVVREVKTFLAVLCTAFGVLSVSLGVAWKAYKPPSVLDYILEFIPFLRPRRTVVQHFLDNVFRLLYTLRSRAYQRCSW